MNDTNLNREGRKPLFTREKGLELLDARRDFDRKFTVREFIDVMVASQIIPRGCCEASMRRLLNGKMFPDMKDAAGKPYDYATIPKAPRGHPRNSDRVDYETGEPKKPMPRLRQQMLDSVLRSARDIIVGELAVAGAEDRHRFGERITRLEAVLNDVVVRLGPAYGDLLPAPHTPATAPEETRTFHGSPRVTGQFEGLIPESPKAIGL